VPLCFKTMPSESIDSGRLHYTRGNCGNCATPPSRILTRALAPAPPATATRARNRTTRLGRAGGRRSPVASSWHTLLPYSAKHMSLVQRAKSKHHWQQATMQHTRAHDKCSNKGCIAESGPILEAHFLALLDCNTRLPLGLLDPIPSRQH
jgi:hypothetical protein